jgi:PAS domain S-box-containing protein
MAEQKAAAPKAMPSILRYGLAVISVTLGALGAFVLERYQFRGVEYPLFLFPIAVTVWYAGVGPAILAVVLSSLSFNYFFTEPRFSFYVTREDVPYYLIFILFALLLTWFSAVRRRVERQLLESRNTLQREIVERTQQASLLNLTHDTIFVRDMDDIITYWNRGAAELFGWTEDQAVGMNSQQLLQTDFPSPIDEVRQELLRTGRWEGELQKTKADGSRVFVASRWSTPG